MAARPLPIAPLTDLRPREGKPWSITILRALNPDGTLLWPEHNSFDQYQALLDSGGSALFNAIWMQDPSGLAGDVFNPEWFRYYAREDYHDPETGWGVADLLHGGLIHAVLPDTRHLIRVQAHDLAISQKETADYYVRINGYGEPRTGRMFVDHVYQARLTLRQMVKDMVAGGKQYDCHAIGIETTAFQASAFQEARRGNFLPFKELDTEGEDKVVRARAVAARYESGDVYHLYGARWLPAFETQLTAFPGAAHDDQVDTVAYLHKLLKGTRGLGVSALAEANEALRKKSLPRHF